MNIEYDLKEVLLKLDNKIDKLDHKIAYKRLQISELWLGTRDF